MNGQSDPEHSGAGAEMIYYNDLLMKEVGAPEVNDLPAHFVNYDIIVSGKVF